MVVTRGERTTVTKARKIKFLEDGELPEDAEVVTVNTRESTREPEEQQEESGSDSDDAPEEESISTSKEASIQKRKADEKLQQELRKQEKEKRKQKDLQFQKQQQAKRQRIQVLASASELPDLLPDEVLESEDEEDAPSIAKHMRAHDLEKEHAEMTKRMKLEKLRQLMQQKTQALKKGPVLVQVNTFDPSKKRVPRAEPSILASKNSWLQRESLGKK